jgi:hypothetical protein
VQSRSVTWFGLAVLAVIAALVPAAPAAAETMFLKPTADTYASSKQPARNFGRSKSLKMSGSPRMVGVLRFDMARVPGLVISATLRMRPIGRQRARVTVLRADGAGWKERSQTWSNMPDGGDLVVGSKTLTTGRWANVSLSPIGQTPLSLVLRSSRRARVASRESHNKPQLLVNYVPYSVLLKGTDHTPAAPPPPPPPPPALQPAPPPPGTLVFQDDFDGTELNTEQWNPYVSPGHAGNGLRRASAFSVSDGLLAVTASWDGANIVSGGMNHRSDYTYGSFEFRVRTEPDPSGQLSGVVLTWPQSDTWIPDGEINMYETGIAPSRSRFFTFVHRSQDGVADSQVKFIHDADATQWHVMRVDWAADSLKVYRDGVLTHTLSDPAQIPNVAHHMSIQLDAFSNHPLPGPVTMYVDWVKIYQ